VGKWSKLLKTDVSFDCTKFLGIMACADLEKALPAHGPCGRLPMGCSSQEVSTIGDLDGMLP
jgi:hypothetical protein